MKSLSFFLLIFSFHSFAGFDQFKKVYFELVYPGYGEMRLEYKVYEVEEPHGDVSNTVLESILSSNYTIGLDSMELEEVQTWNKTTDEVVASITDKLSFGAFFCSRFQADEPYERVSKKECKEKTQKLLSSLVETKDLGRISTLTLVGDYYGDWETIYVIAEKFRSGETLTLEFDIIHEI